MLGISVAAYVRQAVRDKLAVNRASPWMRYVGFVESGEPHSSRNIDNLIYGSQD
ncbi:MAG: CopG family transcriptional regulator [Acidobacteriia bacterium]|nr:CopG family transcriptional regulator [Terriglobia bacterium]